MNGIKRKPLIGVAGWNCSRWLIALIVTIAVVKPVAIVLMVIALIPAVLTLLLLAVAGWMMPSAFMFRGFGWRVRWRWRRTIRRYRHRQFGLVRLLYDPEVVTDARAAQIALMVSKGMSELGEFCGMRLRGRVLVCVLPSVDEIQAIFGDRYGGLAFTRARVIVVPANARIKETIYHELAHLFTARWKVAALPLLNEGFATCWEYGGEYNAHTLVPHFAATPLQIQELVAPNAFYGQQRLHAAYCFAGSFTGFLIRRYGKQRYQRFYSRATRRNFERCFLNAFGLTITEAEARWRVEIAVTQVLRRRLECQLRS